MAVTLNQGRQPEEPEQGRKPSRARKHPRRHRRRQLLRQERVHPPAPSPELGAGAASRLPSPPPVPPRGTNRLRPTARRVANPSHRPPNLRAVGASTPLPSPRARQTEARPTASAPIDPQPFSTASPNTPQGRRQQSPSNPTPPPRQHFGKAQRLRRVRRLKKRPFGSLVYVLRLLIVGVGIGAIVGSLLSAIDPSTQVAADPNRAADTQVQENPEPTHQTSLPLTQEITALKAQFQALAAENPNLQPGVFVVDLDTGNYLDWQGHAIFAAASTIKVPILLAFFQDVDAGKIRLDEPLILQEGAIAAGAGDLQYQQPGSRYTALEVATKMITISDNTATNMLIARLGGAEALNQRFRSWGLSATMIRNPLPDVEGTNTTSPKELAQLMAMVDRGELISLRSRDRLLDIMQQIATESLLPDGLGEGATIAHKTGNIGSLVADAGLVDMPTGKRYIITAMVKRPHNDASAQELIREISRTTYDYFHQPHIAPDSTSMPPDSTAAIAGAFQEPSYDLN